jgi:Domain of unknown function (DUF3576)
MKPYCGPGATAGRTQKLRAGWRGHVVLRITRVLHFDEKAVSVAKLALRTLTILALGALAACGGGKDRPKADLAASQVTTIGVNAWLWRASLETLAFMPMAQTDSAGGVIVTDWYANPQTPSERVKVTVYILDKDLRADALRVAAIRQTLNGTNWTDAELRAGTVQKLEETILARARDLRRAAVAG